VNFNLQVRSLTSDARQVSDSRVAGGVSLGIFNLQVRSLTSDARQVSDLPATFLKFFKVSDL
jgi:hypothetical protein